MLPYIIGAIIGIVVGGLVGALFGWNRRKATAEREIKSAEDEATRDVYKRQARACPAAYGVSVSPAQAAVQCPP